MDHSLRTCELKDLGEILRLERESFPDHPYGRLDFAYFLLTSREGFLVASAGDGSIAGYAIATWSRGEAWIQSIAVSRGSRRRGVGETLLRRALEVAAGHAKGAKLFVDVENAAAIALYRKLSFDETGRVVARYYPNGDDALEMSRPL